ncbi:MULTISPECIES: LacI family DNA-binding transcriptional regulator [Inquilinus]|uniref:LacI family transcriptional regulator n=1 Tax=Inquilinus ginsengisoli TaxID=363840 RepID=A0ABU1JI88_9PROT|nr:substrate-binding domain-containing protein [Inquilinus ginsengisoli]MDR6288325.1 LacI family transcriptional regulator [Inquilinus ginsengisoli]
MVTIKDVARQAGVSFTTVSHVINRTRPVSGETAERVRSAIAALGYFPSDVARALKSNRSRTIGMIVTTTTNPFFGEVMRGVERACFDHGYALMLCNTDDETAHLARYLEMLFAKRVDAVVVMTTHASPEFFRRLGQVREVPVVAIDAAAGIVPSVFNDDSRAGGFLAGDFLARRGFRRIGCIAGPADHPRVIERLDGLRAALAAHGLGVPEALTRRCDLTIAGGAVVARELIALPPGERPEAIFALNDLSAIATLHAAQDAGLSVPADLSVIGYDDIEFASQTFPPLTTIRQPAAEIGAAAATAVLRHLEEGAPLPAAVTLAPELVVRASVGFAIR